MKTASELFSKENYLTEGGLETSIIYQQGIELKHFAAFELLNTLRGRAALVKFYQPHLELAKNLNLGFIMETPTWRANPDWGRELGYSDNELAEINKQSVYFVRELLHEMNYPSDQAIVSGNIGPRGDGYIADKMMTAAEAKVYHQQQIQAFAYADVDVVTAITMTNSDEAIGIVKAAAYFGVPVVISFTVETNGRLPSDEGLLDAIQKVDEQTNGYTSHFMINCAHPEHFKKVLENGGRNILRIKGIRANASCKSHEELDACDSLDSGNKFELAEDYNYLRSLLPNLKIIGGCCGTDHTHLEQICDLWFEEVAGLAN